MPDEKNGDELFEDLDKFFAPIRDVATGAVRYAGSVAKLLPEGTS